MSAPSSRIVARPLVDKEVGERKTGEREEEEERSRVVKGSFTGASACGDVLRVDVEMCSCFFPATHAPCTCPRACAESKDRRSRTETPFSFESAVCLRPTVCWLVQQPLVSRPCETKLHTHGKGLEGGSARLLLLPLYLASPYG